MCSQTYGQTKRVLSIQRQAYAQREAGHTHNWTHTSLCGDKSTGSYRYMCFESVFVFSGSHWLLSISLGPDIAAGNAWECKAVISWKKSSFIMADPEAPESVPVRQTLGWEQQGPRVPTLTAWPKTLHPLDECGSIKGAIPGWAHKAAHGCSWSVWNYPELQSYEQQACQQA